MGGRLALLIVTAIAVGLVLFAALGGSDDGPASPDRPGPEAPPDRAAPLAPPSLPDGVPDPAREDEAPETGERGDLLVRVGDEHNTWVAGALVRVRSLEARTDANGEARFPDVPAGKTTVSAEHPEGMLVRAERSTTVVPGEEAVVNLVLDVGGAVSGIVSGPGGAPLAGPFDIRLEKERHTFTRGGRLPRQTVSTGTGEFRVDGVAPGSWVAVVGAKGYAEGRSDPFEVRVGETTTGVEVRLTRGGRVSGIVTTMSGLPVEGAWVSLVSPGSFVSTGGSRRPVLPGRERMRTDDQGRFLVDGVAPGKWRVAATTDRFAPGRSDEFEVEEGRESAVQVRLGVGGTITGTVYGSDGEPEAGAPVIVQRVMPGIYVSGDIGPRFTTDEHGVYRAELLEPGRYEVRKARSANGASMMVRMVATTGPQEEDRPVGIEVREGQVLVHDLHAVRRGSIRGSLTDGEGEGLVRMVQLVERDVPGKPKPPPGRPVIEMPMIARSRPGGAFVFENLLPGRYRVVVSGEGKEVEVAGGETAEISIRIVPGSVSGVVLDAGGGPAANAEIRLMARGGSEGVRFSNQTGGTLHADEQGRFRFPSVDPGTYGISAKLGATTGRPVEVEVARGEAVKGVRLLLEDTVPVKLVFVDPEGKPAAVDGAVLIGEGDVTEWIHGVGESGTETRLLPGVWRLQVMGRQAEPESLTVTRGGDQTFRVTVKPRAAPDPGSPDERDR